MSAARVQRDRRFFPLLISEENSVSNSKLSLAETFNLDGHLLVLAVLSQLLVQYYSFDTSGNRLTNLSNRAPKGQ